MNRSINVESSALPPQPSYRKVWLTFTDPLLETTYREAMHRQTLGLFRYGMLLAVTLFVLFGVVDFWQAGEHFQDTWPIRAVVVALIAASYALTYQRAFLRFQDIVLGVFLLMLGAGLAAVMAVLPEDIVNQYYVGYLLIVLAAFTVFGLRFPNALLVSFLLVVLYVVSEFALHDGFDVRMANNMAFFVATIFVAASGGYAAELQRRLAYYRGLLLQQAQEASEHTALHDALTGLPNRRLFLERLDHAVARDDRFHTHAALFFIDLDGFKPINDRHGHAFGDGLLKAIAERLLDSVRATDTVARIGGDEFVVLAEDLSEPHCADILAERIGKAFEKPCRVEGVDVPVKMSVGIALHPRDGADASSLLAAADRRMYTMKRNHGRRR